ncbi:PH domain-containing protein [Shewanella sp. WPAGA9]|uniref:PH domain-containing protein n=1 Tax=Shewanella sp. ENK2 TaxID=2775245 RepID=UPI00177FD2F3|nr:PH domain-containing protein [Shewanella sp. WPAGA9]
MNIELAGLTANGLANFIGVMMGLLLLTLLLKLKKMPSMAVYASLGIIIAVFGLFSITLYQTQHAGLSAEENLQVTLTIPLYGQVFQQNELVWQQARVINLIEAPQYMPTRRTNGLGLSGYSLGWFTLQNGDKALVSVTTNENVLLLPTEKGYSLLLSLENPQAAMTKMTAWQD